MSKNLRFSISGLTLAILFILMTSPAQADVHFVNFIVTTYRGYDGFYRSDITAYEAGSNATLVVAVNNFRFDIGGYHYEQAANISAVGVRLDWMAPHTYINSTECSPSNPYELEYEGYHTFIIEFTVPTTPTTLNLALHRFEIIVVNIANMKDVNARQDVIWNWSGDDFAVYSADQADAQELYLELWHKLYYYPYFAQFEASRLRAEAQIKGSIGSLHYERGDFANAKKHFETALDLFDEALKTEVSGRKASAEMSYSQTLIEMEYYRALIDATEREAEASMVQADAAKKQANAAMIQAYAWLVGVVGALIGIGAIGAIVYRVRKSKAPAWG